MHNCCIPCIQRWLSVVIITVVLIEIVMFMRGVFLVLRYANPGFLCPTGDDGNNLTKYKLEPLFKHVVTPIYYSVLAFIRIAEYLVLGVSITRYIRANSISYPSCTIINWLLLMCPALILGLITTGFGLAMEVAYNQGNTQCYPHDDSEWYYIVYCCFNFFRYIFAYSVRVSMLTATCRIREIWKLLSKDTINLELPVPSDPRLAAVRVHKTLSAEYKRRGEDVQKIASIFETWFIIPWIAFFFVTAINTQDVLLPWWQGTDRTVSGWSKAYYLLYHITQFYLLISQYVCGLKMNEYHDNFYQSLRQLQLEFYDDEEYKVQSHQIQVDYMAMNNFSPQIVGINIKTNMESPLYIFLLLIGIFLKTSNTL